MVGFKLRISGVGSDRSTNWATTTALAKFNQVCQFNPIRIVHLEAATQLKPSGIEQEMAALPFKDWQVLCCQKIKCWRRMKTRKEKYLLWYFAVFVFRRLQKESLRLFSSRSKIFDLFNRKQGIRLINKTFEASHLVLVVFFVPNDDELVVIRHLLPLLLFNSLWHLDSPILGNCQANCDSLTYS